MGRVLGILYAAVTATILALAPMPSAQAAPILPGAGSSIQQAVPTQTSEVHWHRRGGYRRAYYRPHRGYYRRAYYRPHRAYYRPVYYRPRPVYYGYRPAYGPRCFWRPARWVFTPYGYQLRPARRICRW